MRIMMAVMLLVGACALLVAGCHCCHSGHKHCDMAQMQTKCPLDGKPINKACYADVNGKRIYGCCSDCVAVIKADPASAMEKVKANGECCMPVPSDMNK